MNIEIIAHRGFSSIAPENTLAAFKAAIKHQADSIEFDLQISADGIPVIFHDENLDRITGHPGKIQEKKLKVLKHLPTGTWFSDEFYQEKIPTLTEALSCLLQIKKYLYFDVKPHCQWNESDIEQLIQLLIDNNLLEKSILTSFNEQFLAKCRQICPMIKIGYFVTDTSEFERQLNKAKAMGNAIISSWYKVLLEEPKWVKESQKEGIDIVAWTVDRPEELQQLVQIGVKRIITNSLIGSRQ
ncbi:MAG: glycerophosphodiester phosphodiesterase family protein [Microcoleaceae cyanobacterium]